MDEPEDGQHEPTLSSSAAATSADGPSSSSPSTSRVQEEEEEGVENERHENGDSSLRRHRHYPLHHILLNRHRQQQQQSSNFSYRVNISISDVPSTEMRDDVWSCLVVLVTFWFFASVTLILGFFGSVNTRLGPNCSRLIQSNPFFVQSIKVEEVDEPKPGPMLYGFYEPPPLDIEIAWTETHMAFVPANLHKEWIYFLNKGSSVDILYNVKSTSPSPLSLVIAQGRESLIEWIEDPSDPNTTLSWNIISESGKIQQKISKPSNYYIAVRNLHSEEAESFGKIFTILREPFRSNKHRRIFTALLELFRLDKCRKAMNTIRPLDNLSAMNAAIYSLKLFLLGRNVAVLTSPHPMEGTDDGWYVKLSFGPRWITYFLGSGIMTILILSAFRFSNMFQTTDENPAGFQAGELGTERVPLLMHKDDDISSWGSSYDSVSQDDEDPEAQLAVNGIEGQQITEGKSINNPQRLCVICFDAPRDCFFLPCGHCAACFTCGTRIAEEAGTCPICRRKMKKVKNIFSV